MHQPWGGAQGQARDIGIQAQEIIRLKKLTIEYFAKHTGKDQGQIALDMERDFYMPALDAVSYGVVDRVLTRDKNGAAS
jgi:ATP-dependent Clp protease protease subunit